jgi:peptidoglycan biosynthesis protein MviN/MurJ (putative lipid II flippase)
MKAFDAAEVATLLGVLAAWLGCFILAGILLYARREYGRRKSRTIGAILIDTSLGFAVLVLALGAVPFVRIVWPAFLPMWGARLLNVGGLVLVVWFAAVRMLVWLTQGDGGQTGPSPRNRGIE